MPNNLTPWGPDAFGTADNIPAGLRDSSTNDQAGGKQCEKKHWYILQPCSKAHIHSLSHSCRLYDVVTSRQKADLKIVINLSIRTLPSTFQASEIIDDKQSLNTIDLWPFFWFILVVRMVNISISRKFQSQNQDLKPRSQVANMTPVEMRSTKRDLEFNEISERSTLEKKSHVKPKRPRNSIQSNHPFSGGEFLQLTRAPTKSCKKIFRGPYKNQWEKWCLPKKVSETHLDPPGWKTVAIDFRILQFFSGFCCKGIGLTKVNMPTSPRFQTYPRLFETCLV